MKVCGEAKGHASICLKSSLTALRSLDSRISPLPVRSQDPTHQRTAVLRAVFGPVLRQPLLLFVKRLGFEDHFFKFKRGITIQSPFLKASGKADSVCLGSTHPWTFTHSFNPSFIQHTVINYSVGYRAMSFFLVMRNNTFSLQTSFIYPRISAPATPHTPLNIHRTPQSPSCKGSFCQAEFHFPI